MAMAKREDGGGGLKPWEQHSSIINIPRFDYKAPSSLLHRSHSGFLVTCPIKREKSATKEAISIFEKCFEEKDDDGDEISEQHLDVKRRKICSEEVGEESLSKVKEWSREVVDESIPKTEKEDASNASISCKASPDETDSLPLGSGARKINLSLVKLKNNGLLLFTFVDDNQHCAVNALSRILCSFESGKMKLPQWCFRIFPIQETCILKEKDLYMVVSKLVQDFFSCKGKELGKPVRFAISYDRRGVDEANNKMPKLVVVDGISEPDLLDRDVCFKVVAKAVKDVAVDSVVDLKSPELIVRIELLPVSGLPAGSVIAGVSVLPRNLVSVKPRGLCVKALVPDSKLVKKSS